MPPLVLGLCVAALVFRITLGVDLSDESYYAAFVDGWLKRGVGDSPFLMIHQTADLLVYPLALLYREVRGDADGLVLFLRSVYLAISVLSATCLYRAIVPCWGRTEGTLVAAFALLFVPFGLPAPSYNTLGMCSLVGALSLFAVGMGRSPSERSPAGGWLAPSLWLSAVWWAIACTAYPPLLVPLTALVLLTLAALRAPAERLLVTRYATACASLLSVALIALCWVLGPARLLEMVRFTNAFNNVSGGLSGKLGLALDAFAAHRNFALMCLAAVALAAARCLNTPRFQLLGDMALGLLVLGVAASDAPTFFSRAHDLVVLLSLTGVFAAARILLSPAADKRPCVIAIVYGASFVGGFTTAAMAFNGLFNFPIGGFLASCLALVLPRSATAYSRVSRRVVMAIACATMATATFSHYYGQIGGFTYRDSVRVPGGAFAGLRTDPDQASFIAQMTEAIERQRGCGNKLAVLGTGPGFYLMTGMSPSALSTWNYPGDEQNYATNAVKSFYGIPANQPDVLVVNNWQWATPLSAADRALLDNYMPVQNVVVGLRKASVYRRRDCTSQR
ncbi:hypothetical protein [Variovorax soli]|uniref:Glycosyltransferase RgtA/B/C/D-like domain-containing protein n=1 Tax=Variovorax soli TaxID=376815 RepID=A0ABU1NC77_9BURK|nr:hypothetical protein [Variovorax soli]MDR6535948.1 hypothetical protein [Variovorax soli]